MEKILKNVLIIKEDVMILGKREESMENFLLDLKKNKVKVYFLEGKSLQTFVKENQICLEQTLFIAATDNMLQKAAKLNMAVIAFENPKIQNQTYESAMILVEGFEELDTAFANRMYQRKHHIPWEIIRTKRTYIREITLEDMDCLFLLYQKKGITDYIEPLKCYEEEMEYTKAYISHQYWFYGYGMWLIFEKESNRLIGRAGLENREVNGEILLEMGYVIDVDYQRKGYAMEVCTSMISYARECLEFPYLHCFVDKRNKASIKLLEKLSFEKANEVLINNNKHFHFKKKLEK